MKSFFSGMGVSPMLAKMRARARRPCHLKAFASMTFAALGGCSNYTQVQMDLVTQARRGVALAAQTQTNQSVSVAELAKMRRQRLDAAFDADVIDQGADLNADWVIEARKAYGTVLDAYAKERAATTQAEAAARRNLDDIDAALARVQSLQATQLKLSQPIEQLLTNTTNEEE